MKNRKYYLFVLFIVLSAFYFYQADKLEKERQENKLLSYVQQVIDEQKIKMQIEARRRAEKPWASDFLWEMIIQNASTDKSTEQLAHEPSDNQSYAAFEADINEKVGTLIFIIVGWTHKDSEARFFYPRLIEIRNASDRKLIQKINLGDTMTMVGYADKDLSILQLDMVEFVDLNFDGYLDLRALLHTGATGVNWYDSFLYNPASKKFIFNKKLSEMTTVRVDPNSRQITSYSRSGWCDEYMKYYELIDNRYMLTKVEETQNWSDEQGDRRCYRFTMIPVKGRAMIDDEFYHYEIREGVKWPTGYSIYKKDKLSNKLKITKKEEINSVLDLDGRRRGSMGVPY